MPRKVDRIEEKVNTKKKKNTCNFDETEYKNRK